MTAWARRVALACALASALAVCQAAEVELIDATTPWRAYLVSGYGVQRQKGGLVVFHGHSRFAFDPMAPDEEKAGLSTMPPTDWTKAEFDDHLWGRYQPDELNDYLGNYGVPPSGSVWPALLCLRTCFGIVDPGKTTDVKVTVTCIGGGVVYVNGLEVGRAYVPKGTLHPLTPAEDYPPEVYVTEDGTVPLPALLPTTTPEAKWRQRYEKRLRTFTIAVPSRVLVKGTALGNPYDPLLPVKILVPRNGTGSGQVAVSDVEGVKELAVRVGDFVGPSGARLPAGAVQVRYAAQLKPEAFQGDQRMAPVHYCDALMDRPPQGAKTVPVWLLVETPRDQAPGWYASTLSAEANGRQLSVPVRVFVSPFTAPDAKDLRSLIGVMHSPETLAATYKVDPYSEAHFKLMARLLAMAGQLGNDVMYVPVIVGTHMGHQTGLIRWVKTDKGLRPDFSLFEKYLDLYGRHCALPRAISLYVWSHETAKESAGAYEGAQVPLRHHVPKRPLMVTQWDPATGATTDIPAPAFVDDGAEAFWEPVLDGVREIVVKKRGWPERIIMLGCGCDSRPSPRTGELARKWAPYARWDIYSHFSGDPGSMFYDRKRSADDATLTALRAGKFIAVGDLEVGLKEVHSYYLFSAPQWQQYRQKQAQEEFLELFIQRLVWNEQSPPMAYRTVPLYTGRLARVGLDFWPVDAAARARRHIFAKRLYGLASVERNRRLGRMAAPGGPGRQATRGDESG